MRLFALICVSACLSIAADMPAGGTTTTTPVKGKSTSKRAGPVLPKVGVKTPGVQIAFSSLKPEAEYPVPSKPEWMAFASDTIWIPDSKTTSLARIDPKAKDNKLAAPIFDLNQACGGVASGFGSVWTLSCGGDRSLQKIDVKGGKVTTKYALGASPGRSSIAASTDSIWALTDDKGTLSRIDPEQGVVVAELRVPVDCRGLTFAETSLWLACPAEDKVLRINPATNLVDKSIPVAAQPEDIAFGEGSIWTLCRKEGKVDRIDPKTNKVSKTIELEVPGANGAISFGEGALWVTQDGFPLTRIDPTTEKVVQQFYGEGGGAVLAAGGFLWLSNPQAGTLWKVDPKRVLATLAE